MPTKILTSGARVRFQPNVTLPSFLPTYHRKQLKNPSRDGILQVVTFAPMQSNAVGLNLRISLKDRSPRTEFEALRPSVIILLL